jgi:hypothetical protein
MHSPAIIERRLNLALEAFEEALDFSGLCYSSQDLQAYGFEDDHSVQVAVKRAMQLCRSLEIEPKRHFRLLYNVDMKNCQAFRQWRVSRLGFYLVLCNGAPTNPFVGAFQMKLIRKLIAGLD